MFHYGSYCEDNLIWLKQLGLTFKVNKRWKAPLLSSSQEKVVFYVDQFSGTGKINWLEKSG